MLLGLLVEYLLEKYGLDLDTDISYLTNLKSSKETLQFEVLIEGSFNPFLFLQELKTELLWIL